MKKINDILGYKNLKIFQDDEYFSFSLDSVMLANFVNVRLSDKKIVDLGCGNGVIPLILSLRTKNSIVGVEIQEKLSLLALESIKYNNLSDQISIINQDMKTFAIDNCERFDVVTCNPPFFKYDKNSFLNLSMEKVIARHEIAITLEDVLKVSKKILKNNGILAMVHRPERLLEILDQFRLNNIEPKRLRFVYSKLEKDSIMVLIEGIKNGKPGLKIERPFILYNSDGTFSLEYNNLVEEVVR